MLRLVRDVDTLWLLRLLPPFSILSLLVQYSYRTLHPHTKSSNEERLSSFSYLVKQHGGSTILTFNVVRLIGCVGLFLIAVRLELKNFSNMRIFEIVHGMIPFYVRTTFFRVRHSLSFS